MAVQITAIHLVNGRKHEHIAEVAWTNPNTNESGKSTRTTMVDWLTKPSNQAYVTDGISTVDVGVVKATPPYLRTHADGKWTDNLLALPEY